jgi:hypothetical protein
LEWLAHRWFRLGSPFFETNPPENHKRTNGLLCRNTILCPSVDASEGQIGSRPIQSGERV